MSLSTDTMRSFKLSKIFEEPTVVQKSSLSSISIDDSGALCAVCSAEDESIHIYDMIHGKYKKPILSRKYGISRLSFTHRNTNLLVITSRPEPSIRYLSTHDNQFIRYFKGHKNTVRSLALSPTSDSFLSASSDSIRVWDLRTPNCQGLMSIASSSVQLAMDPQGLVAAIGVDNKSIRMFDVRNYGQGPFSIFSLQIPSDEIHSHSISRQHYQASNWRDEERNSRGSVLEWNSFEFSPDGKDILISTKNTSLALIDSFQGFVKERYEKNVNDESLSLTGCFSPDGKWILCGSSDGCVNVWRRSVTGSEKEKERESSFGHKNKDVSFTLDGLSEAVACVKFNPVYSVFATISGKKLGFWIPEY